MTQSGFYLDDEKKPLKGVTLKCAYLQSSRENRKRLADTREAGDSVATMGEGGQGRRGSVWVGLRVGGSRGREETRGLDLLGILSRSHGRLGAKHWFGVGSLTTEICKCGETGGRCGADPAREQGGQGRGG